MRAPCGHAACWACESGYLLGALAVEAMTYFMPACAAVQMLARGSLLRGKARTEGPWSGSLVFLVVE